MRYAPKEYPWGSKIEQPRTNFQVSAKVLTVPSCVTWTMQGGGVQGHVMRATLSPFSCRFGAVVCYTDDVGCRGMWQGWHHRLSSLFSCRFSAVMCYMDNARWGGAGACDKGDIVICCHCSPADSALSCVTQMMQGGGVISMSLIVFGMLHVIQVYWHASTM
jgi:hypothetical protein